VAKLGTICARARNHSKYTQSTRGLLPRRMILATERSFNVSLNDSGAQIDNRVPWEAY
jgi:hypothetical protein